VDRIIDEPFFTEKAAFQQKAALSLQPRRTHVVTKCPSTLRVRDEVGRRACGQSKPFLNIKAYFSSLIKPLIVFMPKSGEAFGFICSSIFAKGLVLGAEIGPSPSVSTAEHISPLSPRTP
jgi:hypothetical protein